MSIMVAYNKNGVVYLGTDTRIIKQGTITDDLCENNYKIKKFDDVLVGITGNYLVRQMVFAYPEIFTLPKSKTLTKKHIVKNIVPKLINILFQNDLLVQENDERDHMQANIVIAHKGELFEITRTFTVYKYKDYQVLGNECDVAEAVIFNAKNTDDVNEIIVKALKYASKNSDEVGSPYLLIDTKDLKYTLVGDNI